MDVSLHFSKRCGVMLLVLVFLAGCSLSSIKDSCRDLQDMELVQQTLQEQAGVVAQIEALRPGYITFSTATRASCPGKGLIVIQYAAERDRQAIMEFIRIYPDISHNRFFGIPYILSNV
jgi:hypothetical protein